MIRFRYLNNIGNNFVPNSLHQEHTRYTAWLNKMDEFKTDFCANPLEKLLRTKKIEISHSLSQQDEQFRQAYFIPVENLYSSVTYLRPDRCPEFNFWDNISNNFYEDLHRKKAFLLFTDMKRIFEGPRGDLFTENNNWFYLFYKVLKQKKIPTNQCIVAMPVPEVQHLHEQYCKKENIPKEKQITTLFVNFYEMAWNEVAQLYRKQNKIISPSTVNLKSNNIRPKHYLYQNNEPRYHRRALLAWLYKNNFIKMGYVSFLNRRFSSNIEKNYDLSFSDSSLDKLLKCFENMNCELPLVLDTSQVHLTNYSSWPFNETYFSIIAERIFNSSPGWTLPTSKIFKTIDSLHPFILLAQPGTLKHLRSLGYKTFPDFFDESYDEITCHAERFKAVQFEIKKLCTLKREELHKKYVNCFDLLIHNQKLLSKRWLDSEFHSLVSYLDARSFAQNKEHS